MKDKKADFTGREVSCRAFGFWFKELEKKGLSPEILADWSGYPLEHLLNKHERIDWSSHSKIMDNVGKIYSDEELEEMGGRWLKSHWMRHTMVLIRLLWSATDHYRWIARPGTGGNLFFTCVHPSYREIGPNHVEIKLIMQSGYEPCREFFLISKGTFVVSPTFWGLGPAVVEMEEIDGGVRYDIKVPPGGRSLTWLWRAITWPFTIRSAAEELKEAHEQLHERYSELEKEKAALRESEERFRIATEGAMAGVYIIQDDRFKYVNPALAQTFGYTPDELIDRLGPLDLTHPDDRALVAEQLRRRLSGEIEEIRYTFRGLRKDGKTIHCGVLSRQHDYKGRPAVIGTLVDITEQIKADEKMKRRLMRFRLEDGTLYLVKETVPTLSVEAFKDLLKVGYHGLVISRTPEDEFRKTLDGDYDFSWLSEKGGERALPPRLEEIELSLENLPRRNAVLIERLDYLVFKNGFDETLSFVQRLRDLAYLNGHVVIIPIDPQTLGKRELSLLEKETKEVEALHREALPEDLLEVLRFIYKQNTIGIKPSYTDVSRSLGISRPTVQKRMGLLKSAGYVMEVVRGRSKAVELSEKGRSLFLR